MKHQNIAIVLAASIAIHAPASAQEITVESAQPVVVKTIPEAGSATVDAVGTTGLRVTFSKEMNTGSWSWCNLPDKIGYPETTGKPRYLEDKRTCVLPVKLKPGTTYAVWINTQHTRNFMDTKRQPAAPYLLVFKTKE